MTIRFSRRRLGGFLLAGSVACASSWRNPPEDDARLAQCIVREVSRAPLRVEGGRQLYVEPVALAESGGEVLIAGWPTYLWTRSADGKVVGVVRDSVFGAVVDAGGRGRTVPSPIAGRPHQGVRAVARAQGGWDVAFVEFPGGDRARSPEIPPTLWFGSFDGTRWSALERIPVPAGGRLRTSTPSRLVRFGDTLAWAFVRQGEGRRSDAIVYTRTPQGWTHEEVRTENATAVELGHSPATGLALVLTRPDFTQQRDANSVFLYTRTPEWVERGKLVAGGSEPAYDVALDLSGGEHALSWWSTVRAPGSARREARARLGQVDGPASAAIVLDSSMASLVPVPRAARAPLWLLEHLSDTSGGPREIRMLTASRAGAKTLWRTASPFTGTFAAVSIPRGRILLTGGQVVGDPPEAVVSFHLLVDVACSAGA